MAENVNNMIEETTVDITNKKCPNCGATVVYNPETLSMTCEYCGYSKKLPEPDSGEVIEELDFNSAKIRNGCDWGAVKKTVVCKNCGAESVYDSVDTAALCPFCGSTSVMPVDQDKDAMAPGGVVPFEVSKDKAAELFHKWLKKRFFTPSAAKKQCKADNFNGIYLPFWTYDTLTTSSYSAKLGFDKKRKDKVVTTWRTYRGVYQEFIDDQVVYASKKTNNNYVKQLMKFDFSKLRPYDPQLIAGFAAERYSLGLDEGWGIAKNSISSTLKSHVESQLRSQYHPDHVLYVNLATSYENVTFKYILGPMWIASFKYKNKVYNFAVNGQTGRVSGAAPISPLRVAIVAAIVAILVFIFLYFSYYA